MLRVLGLAALLLTAAPVAAQVRTVVVPEGGGIVIGPRGSPQPPRGMMPVYRSATRRARPRRAEPSDETPGLRTGLSLLPLVAAAVLGATLPGSNSGGTTTATVRTR